MGEFGFDKLLLIAVVVLLLFGARRLPEIGASLGKGIREFKRGISDADDSVKDSPPRSNGPASSTTGDPKRLSD
jgi:sec-independent protein translocase protein TatA